MIKTVYIYTYVVSINRGCPPFAFVMTVSLGSEWTMAMTIHVSLLSGNSASLRAPWPLYKVAGHLVMLAYSVRWVCYILYKILFNIYSYM